MSFSSDVKQELETHISPARHCRIAEVAAIISLCGQVKKTKFNRYILKISTENIIVARKCFTLLKKTFNINIEIIIKSNHSSNYGYTNKIYNLIIMEHDIVFKILQATKLINQDRVIQGNFSLVNNKEYPLVTQKTCCKRAFLRGVFLVSGSISNPNKDYHFEIVVPFFEKAVQLQEVMKTFDIDAKIVKRKKNFVVYLKESAQIVDILNVMEAHVALMEFENVRIYKDMRNSINRQVNCETANISKTVKAATNQIDDINYLKNHDNFKELSNGLKEIALLRVDNPDATLKELGEMLDPPLSKSGVNHRLRKISRIADKLKEQKEAVSND